MKQVKQTGRDELRAEYKPSDFPEGLVRGKYAKRVRESSNIVVLKAVNSALLSLIELAQKTTRPTRRSTGSAKKLRAG